MAESAELFVANLTKQHQQFIYRVGKAQDLSSPTGFRYQHQVIEHIPIGSQIRVGGKKLKPEEIADIIAQKDVYGLVDARTLQNVREFTGLCYSVGSPVKIDLIVERVEENDKFLNKEAKERLATVAETVANYSRNIGQQAGVEMQRAEVETIEDTKGTPSVADGVEVTMEGVKPRRHGREKVAVTHQ